MRVVSLLPSATEIVHALGAGASLVGRSHECDFPHGVEALPFVTAPKWPFDGTSYEVDARVKAVAHEGLAIYRVDIAALDALEPDVIITQAQCDVCAVSLRDVETAVCQLVRSRPRIVALQPNALADVFADLERVADALALPERGRALVTSLRAQMRAVGDRVAAAPARPTLACIEWIEPLMGAGNWMPELVTLAGGRMAFGEPGAHSPWIDLDALVAADPDVILVAPCGFDITRTRRDLPVLQADARWSSLRAVRTGRVFVGDGHQYFNRPGPRLVDSLTLLAAILHPDRVALGAGVEAID